MNNIVELKIGELEEVSGGPLPVLAVAFVKAVGAAATSTTGKAVFAGAFVAAAAAATDVFGSED